MIQRLVYRDVTGMFITDREATKAGLNPFGVVMIGSEVIFITT